MNEDEIERGLYCDLVNSTPGPWDIRLILPVSADSKWLKEKRLFTVTINGLSHVNMTPLCEDGETFKVTREYIKNRTIIIPRATTKAGMWEGLKNILSKEAYEYWIDYSRRYIKKSESIPRTGVMPALNYQKQDVEQWDKLRKENTVSDHMWGYHSGPWERAGGSRRSAKILHYKGENKMEYAVNKVKQEAATAVKTATKITAGRTVNGLAADKLGKFLPEKYQPFADTPIGAVVIANLVSAIANIYAESNGSEVAGKLTKVSESMVLAATVDFVGAFDIDLLVREFLSSTEVSAVLDTVENA